MPVESSQLFSGGPDTTLIRVKGPAHVCRYGIVNVRTPLPDLEAFARTGRRPLRRFHKRPNIDIVMFPWCARAFHPVEPVAEILDLMPQLGKFAFKRHGWHPNEIYPVTGARLHAAEIGNSTNAHQPAPTFASPQLGATRLIHF
jgi:hypothetical protein